MVDAAELDFARGILRRGAEVNSMMKVIGEEGTAIEDFVTYLKSEFLDYTYLQQNTFDEVDGATDSGRQQQMFAEGTPFKAAEPLRMLNGLQMHCFNLPVISKE